MNSKERSRLLPITITKNNMWKIRYKHLDKLPSIVYVKARSINEAIEIYQDNYNEEILSIDHDERVEVIT